MSFAYYRSHHSCYIIRPVCHNRQQLLVQGLLKYEFSYFHEFVMFCASPSLPLHLLRVFFESKDCADRKRRIGRHQQCWRQGLCGRKCQSSIDLSSCNTKSLSITLNTEKKRVTRAIISQPFCLTTQAVQQPLFCHHPAKWPIKQLRSAHQWVWQQVWNWWLKRWSWMIAF